MSILLNTIKRFFNERFFDQAAQIAYYLLVSMLPFLIFVFSLVSLITPDAQAILNMVEPFVPQDAFILIEKNIRMILRRTEGNVVYFSLIIAFWLSSIAIQSLGRALDLANGHVRNRPFWRVVLRDLGITLLFMLVFPLTLFLPPIDEALHRFMTTSEFIQVWEGWQTLRTFIRWGIGSLFLFLFFLLFYRILPTEKMAFREVFPGAIFVTLIWQLFSLSFGKYVSNVDYTMLYGQLSTIIVLVLWFYSTAVIILLAGLLNAEIKKKGRSL